MVGWVNDSLWTTKKNTSFERPFLACILAFPGIIIVLTEILKTAVCEAMGKRCTWFNEEICKICKIVANSFDSMGDIGK